MARATRMRSRFCAVTPRTLVVIQLDSQSATKVTNEHYRLQLEDPIRIPYLSQPRCNLEALSFQNSFTNVDGARLNNNKIRLAWKVHEPTDTDKTYDSLPWHTLELSIDNSFQTTTSIEAEIARQIESRSSDTSTFGNDLLTTLNRMVGNKPVYGGAGAGEPVDPQPISTTTDHTPADGGLGEFAGTRDPKLFAFTSLCWYYGPKAKYFFPEASGADDTIVVIMEANDDYQPHFQPSNAYGNAGSGLNFHERYIGGEYDNKNHWYSSLPSFLIGASLEGVTDPDRANRPDITGALHLEFASQLERT